MSHKDEVGILAGKNIQRRLALASGLELLWPIAAARAGAGKLPSRDADLAHAAAMASNLSRMAGAPSPRLSDTL